MDAPVRASLGAKPASGRFPIVVYAPGVGGPADENADLFEYLASHGYVVLASVGAGADGREVEESLAGVEPQVADINFLIRYAQSLSNADAGRLAVMGWSWGGMSILFAAEQDARIGAVISLDGTREPALTRLIDVKRLKAPWLYVSRTPDTIPQINRAGIDTTFSLLNEAKHAPVTQLIMYPMQHGDFVSRRIREDSPATYDEYSREEVRQAFGMVALYVRHFLDAHLRKAAASQSFLARQPADNGAARHSIRVERSVPAATPE
jgi:dienelactone hydrolase